jgi:hypothetical protein
MKRARLGPKRLLKLLNGKDDEYYGEARRCASCPIATALKEVTDADYASVTQYWIEYGKIYGPRVSYPTPPWARRFIDDVDHHVKERHGPVPRSYSIAVLEEIIDGGK